MTEADGARKEEGISEGRAKLRSWLNRSMRIVLTDGRILVGTFLCTDKDANIILGTCTEKMGDDDTGADPRVLGLAMVPGRHISSIDIDDISIPKPQFPIA